MPKFSIIVPVYNAEKTLRRCFDSVLGQTERDFEVVMIENGSKDKSCGICLEYAEKDERFFLYPLDKNIGPSGARNKGLDNIKGEFVAFLDSDDFLEPDHLETVSEALGGADAVFFGYREVSQEGVIIGEHVPEISENADYFEKLIELWERDMFGYTWIKAFRREAMGEIRFDEKLDLMEDEVFACKIFEKKIKTAVVPKALYNYVTGNPESLVSRIHPDYCRKTDAAYKAWKKLLEKYGRKEEILSVMAKKCAERCMYYGFEHEVSTRDFFDSLKRCSFFEESEHETLFEKCVEKERYKELSFMKKAYDGKEFLYRSFKKWSRK